MEWFGGLKKVKKQNGMEWVEWWGQTWGKYIFINFFLKIDIFVILNN